MTQSFQAMFIERRQSRSTDPLVALHYQLAKARKEASLETLILADSAGVMVAGVGSWSACEELAAYAPLLAREGDGDEPSRFASLRAEVELRAVDVEGQRILLCARGRRHPQLDATLSQAAEGVARILAA